MRQAIAQAVLAPAEIGAGQARQQLCFTEDFPGFAGHFPDYPILPAVVQVLSAQLLAEQLLGRKLILERLEKAKFTRQLRPGETILLQIEFRQHRGREVCQASLSCGEETAASFWLNLTSDEMKP